jgi:hypothetical protein
MEIRGISITKDSLDRYRRSENSVFHIFSLVAGLMASAFIIWAVARIPGAGNLWLALFISLSLVIYNLSHIVSGMRHKPGEKPVE